MDEGREKQMRKKSTPRVLVAALAACFALAIVPAATAASPDLIQQVQTLVGSPGTLPTDPAELQQVADGLAQGGLISDTDPASVLANLQAIQAAYAAADPTTIAEILDSGLSAAQITGLGDPDATLAPADLQKIVDALPTGSTPTGTDLKPLSDAFRTIA